MEDIEFKPTTPIREGIQQFADWYLNFYRTESS
jgi:nucleoside-diphosphate-sugar epimerase